MELGSLPEWFTACAEVLAVCTALFLPQYRAYRDRRESLARMRRVTKGMLADLVDERQARPSADPDQLESAQELELYLRVSFFVLSDAREIALRGQVERLYRLMNDRVEALEFIARASDSYIGVPLKNLTIRKGALVAVIVRQGKVIVPFGDDHIEDGDRVVVIACENGIDDLNEVIHR